MLLQSGAEEEHYPQLTPAKLLEQQRQFGRLPSTTPPQTVIFCHQSYFVKEILQHTPHTVYGDCFSKLYLLHNNPGIAISDFGRGAATAASKMEQLIAWGVEQFISLTAAGTLQSKAQVGDLVVCEKAVRDESTSKHYIPSSKYIHAPRRMINKLQSELKKADLPYHIGCTWTTDNFYNRSEEEILLYRHEGVLTVDKEVAALFAVAHFFQVDLGALFTISDVQNNLIWEPNHEDTRVSKGLHDLLKVALESAQEKSG